MVVTDYDYEPHVTPTTSRSIAWSRSTRRASSSARTGYAEAANPPNWFKTIRLDGSEPPEYGAACDEGRRGAGRPHQPRGLAEVRTDRPRHPADRCRARGRGGRRGPRRDRRRNGRPAGDPGSREAQAARMSATRRRARQGPVRSVWHDVQAEQGAEFEDFDGWSWTSRSAILGRVLGDPQRCSALGCLSARQAGFLRPGRPARGPAGIHERRHDHERRRRALRGLSRRRGRSMVDEPGRCTSQRTTTAGS